MTQPTHSIADFRRAQIRGWLHGTKQKAAGWQEDFLYNDGTIHWQLDSEGLPCKVGRPECIRGLRIDAKLSVEEVEGYMGTQYPQLTKGTDWWVDDKWPRLLMTEDNWQQYIVPHLSTKNSHGVRTRADTVSATSATRFLARGDSALKLRVKHLLFSSSERSLFWKKLPSENQGLYKKTFSPPLGSAEWRAALSILRENQVISQENVTVDSPEYTTEESADGGVSVIYFLAPRYSKLREKMRALVYY